MTSLLSKVSYILFIFNVMVGCGKNQPAESKRPNSQDVERSGCEAGQLYVSASKKWIADVKWQVGPSSGGEDGLENKFCVSFYGYDSTFDGKSMNDISRESLTLAEDIDGLQVTAWMPTMGHDTGSEKPQVKSMGKGQFSVANVWLYMTGDWEVIMTSKSPIDGETTKFMVQVKE